MYFSSKKEAKAAAYGFRDEQEREFINTIENGWMKMRANKAVMRLVSELSCTIERLERVYQKSRNIGFVVWDSEIFVLSFEGNEELWILDSSYSEMKKYAETSIKYENFGLRSFGLNWPLIDGNYAAFVIGLCSVYKDFNVSVRPGIRGISNPHFDNETEYQLKLWAWLNVSKAVTVTFKEGRTDNNTNCFWYDNFWSGAGYYEVRIVRPICSALFLKILKDPSPPPQPKLSSWY